MKFKINSFLTLGLISLFLTSCNFSEFMSAYESFQESLLGNIKNEMDVT